MNDLDRYLAKFQEMAISYAPKLALAIITLLAGLWIISILTKVLRKTLTSKEMDPSLIPFLCTLFNMMLKVMLAISVIQMVGIETTSFVAVLGAAGLAIGMALGGTLQNFAGGVLILLFKPFKVGDLIEAQGHLGVVREIQIFNTILTTMDNVTIIIPNGGLSTESMKNYSTEPFRRVDLSFGIAYGDDYQKARALMLELIAEDKRILNEPAEPFVVLGELGDSSVNLTVRVWVAQADYWGVHFSMKQQVYERFGEAGLSIPFPQMDVHMHQA